MHPQVKMMIPHMKKMSPTKQKKDKKKRDKSSYNAMSFNYNYIPRSTAYTSVPVGKALFFMEQTIIIGSIA
jgi:hypothetical protein